MVTDAPSQTTVAQIQITFAKRFGFKGIGLDRVSKIPPLPNHSYLNRCSRANKTFLDAIQASAELFSSLNSFQHGSQLLRKTLTRSGVTLLRTVHLQTFRPTPITRLAAPGQPSDRSVSLAHITLASHPIPNPILLRNLHFTSHNHNLNLNPQVKQTHDLVILELILSSASISRLDIAFILFQNTVAVNLNTSSSK
ncbi:hypothetical protein CROQUDRAFT_97131 [Cronartium quercuum f. sp. fusiforme G11]|uniref:Uncharacterized protein n=1 Tax=Cronartium quercuum f. sp. fusiforme G11 TaxID=708437 RepID=A0A9P6NA33_9BASI|nr:hypothetical protein CROQUDRAFT_97131 [Cronartium quercuum f. sp. fusiforme G11]